MPQIAVLAVGLGPAFADFAQFPELTPEVIGAYIRRQTDRVRQAGFGVVDCLISPDAAGDAALRAAICFDTSPADRLEAVERWARR
jgi:hypothetical protein